MRNVRARLVGLLGGQSSRGTWGQQARLRALVAGLGASALLFGGVWTAVQAQEVIPATVVDVPIQAFVFQPATISVPVGTVVRWTNLDPVDHTVTDIDMTWDSGLFGASGTYSMAFDTPGTYTYFCIPHPTMIGTIEVTG